MDMLVYQRVNWNDPDDEWGLMMIKERLMMIGDDEWWFIRMNAD